jgi:hypothetical protein
MQVRCYNCHRPFALSKDTVHAALDLVTREDLHHFNAQCPHCRRTNRISKEELMRAAPNWEPSQEGLQENADQQKEESA